MLGSALAIGMLGVLAETPAVDPWAPEPQLLKVQDSAAKEAKALGRRHPWAGSYYAGDGLGANQTLTIAPRAGFSFTWTGCMGLYGQSYGAVSQDGDRLRFEPSRPSHDKFGRVDDLIPVLWGERHYLVRADKISDFCNNVNAGYEPRKEMHGLVLLRRGDEKRRTQGLPVLPGAPAGCILSQPLQARITAVGATERTASGDTVVALKTPLHLSVGSADGVWVGMEFHSASPCCSTITITRVEDHASEGEIHDYQLKDAVEANVPAVGSQVATKLQ
jgi:hypothetical protein